MKREAGTGAAGRALPQIGAADPERRNSPWQSDPQESFGLLREQVGDEAGWCYFNDVRYADGAEVLSGDTRLKCERGIWVELTERQV